MYVCADVALLPACVLQESCVRAHRLSHACVCHGACEAQPFAVLRQRTRGQKIRKPEEASKPPLSSLSLLLLPLACCLRAEGSRRRRRLGLRVGRMPGTVFRVGFENEVQFFFGSKALDESCWGGSHGSRSFQIFFGVLGALGGF